MDSTLELLMKPEWDEIDKVRQRGAALLIAHELPPDSIDALTMVLSELMENAVKYGYYEGAQKDIAVSLDVAPNTVTVEVKSPLREHEDAAMARLDHMIQWIRGYQDPFQAYLVRLKEVSAQSLDSTESGLGLVRIAYEGQSVLDFYVDDRNVLAINAVYSREPAPAATVAR